MQANPRASDRHLSASRLHHQLYRASNRFYKPVLLLLVEAYIGDIGRHTRRRDSSGFHL